MISEEFVGNFVADGAMAASRARLAAAAAARGLRPSPLTRGLAPSLARGLASSLSRSPHAILGLEVGASKNAIKNAYYALAKLTHPDAVGDAGDDDAAGTSSAPSFVEVLAAFEELMDEADARGAGPASSRRGGGPARRAGAVYRSTRRVTLGEALCARLEWEPEAARDVWAEILAEQCAVAPATLDLLFRACGERSDLGLPAALEILREASRSGLLDASTRAAAMVSMVKWCKSSRDDFEAIHNEIAVDGGGERDPELQEMVHFANMLYAGTDGYSSSK